ncbi:2654_t:CDS:1, partial [Dentiscutata heterogama]
NKAHILLCDGPCGKNFYTRCLKTPLSRILAGNWNYTKCESEIQRNQT